MGSGAQLWPVQRLEGTSERGRGSRAARGELGGVLSEALLATMESEEKTPHVCPGPKCTF